MKWAQLAGGLFGAALLLFASCGERTSKQAPSDEILGRADFIEVMAEVQLIEAAMKQRILVGDDGPRIAEAAYQDLFERHDITDRRFEESHEYWFGKPESMVEIMQEVTERLTAWEREVEAESNSDSSGSFPE